MQLNDLPPEMLARIFLEGCDIPAEPPRASQNLEDKIYLQPFAMKAAVVCSKWRNVVLEDSNLYFLSVDLLHRSTRAITVERLEIWNRIIGCTSCRIDLFIDGRYLAYLASESGGNSELASHAQNILAVLFRHAHRWRSLWLQGGKGLYRNNLKFLDEHFFRGTRQTAVRASENILSRNAKEDRLWCHSLAPSFQYMTIGLYGPQRLQQMTSWNISNVVYLELLENQQHFSWNAAEQSSKLELICPALQSLKLWSSKPSNDFVERLVAPLLKNLAICKADENAMVTLETHRMRLRHQIRHLNLRDSRIGGGMSLRIYEVFGSVTHVTFSQKDYTEGWQAWPLLVYRANADSETVLLPFLRCITWELDHYDAALDNSIAMFLEDRVDEVHPLREINYMLYSGFELSKDLLKRSREFIRIVNIHRFPTKALAHSEGHIGG